MRRTPIHWLGWLLLAVLVGAVPHTFPLVGQDLAQFEERTTLHPLENGWKFIIVERRELRSSPSTPMSTWVRCMR